MFSTFFHVLQNLHRANLINKIPIVYWHGGMYAKKNKRNNHSSRDNVWEYYFEPVSEYSIEMFPHVEFFKYCKLSVKNKNNQCVEVSSKFQSNFGPDNCWTGNLTGDGIYNPSLKNRVFINQIINKYIKVKHSIQNEIDSFYDRHMKNRNVLGVHIRGYHKKGFEEHTAGQGRNPLKNFAKKIEQYIDENTDCKILLATDYDHNFRFIKKRFGKKIISYNAQRSTEKGLFSLTQKQTRVRLRRGKPLGGPKWGSDVLIECLLLSRCKYLLRGCSSVSAAAIYFNKNLNNFFVPQYELPKR